MSAVRAVIAVCVGFFLSIFIWVVVPYNNFLLNNSFVSDGYLPEIVMLLLVLLVLLVNPALARISPAAAFSQQQIIIIVSMLLFAAVIPSNGLMRFFPHSLAMATQQINESDVVASAVSASRLPAALFPDAIGPGLDTPVVDTFLDELHQDEAIPWGSWIAPMLSWGALIVAFWTLMIGLGFMVLPQWMNHERLPFPLLRIYGALVEPPAEGRAVAPLFISRLFWIGFGAVFLLYTTNGLSILTGGGFPAFPLRWDISYLFKDGVWVHAPGFLRGSRLFFLFLGLAYFMPNRYSFSIWFMVLAYGLFIMFARTYMPLFQPLTIYDQTSGAFIAMAAWVVWLGRSTYWRLFLSAVGMGSSEEIDPVGRLAARLFLGGAMGMLVWFMWAGTGFIAAVGFVLLAIVIMIMVARVVAETGVAYIWIIPLTATRIFGLFPSRFFHIATVLMERAHYVVANRASAVSAAVMAMLALGLNRNASVKHKEGLAWLGLGVLVIGFIVCGAVHLHMGYHHATSLDGINMPVAGRGAQMMSIDPMRRLLTARETGFAFGPLRTMVGGVVFAIALLMLCARFPSWPLHPVGLLFVYSSIGLRITVSIFFGWLIKSLMLRYGGNRAYRACIPLFLGIMFGEIFANAFWTLVPVVQILFGADPVHLQRLIIFQYT